MNLTPQSMRSPMSPEYQHSKRSFSSQRPCYPATPQPESASLEQPNRGLGIFDCPLPQQQSTIQELPPSPQPSDSWSHSSVMEHDFPQTSQPPDIFSAAFDPFSGYSNSANSGMTTTQSPEAPGLVFCQTPPSTNMPSHRSSISSSYSSPESFQHGSEYYTPRVKQEDSNEWYPAPGNDQVLQRSMTLQAMSPYNGVSPINGPSDDCYKNQPNDWSKQNMGYEVDITNGAARSKFDAAPTLPSINRIKKKRQRTTPEEATHECRVCGKLFKRSYNWKSHLETHNPERKYPHPCTAMIGNAPCTKKFQRKTDLDRHYDSVSSAGNLLSADSVADVICRYISRPVITDVIYVAIASLAEIRYGDTLKTGARSDMSSMFAKDQPLRLLGGHLRISLRAADLTAWECHNNLRWRHHCQQLHHLRSPATTGHSSSAVQSRHHRFLFHDNSVEAVLYVQTRLRSEPLFNIASGRSLCYVEDRQYRRSQFLFSSRICMTGRANGVQSPC